MRLGAQTVRFAAVVSRRHEPSLAKMPNWEDYSRALELLGNVIPPVPATEADIRALWLRSSGRWLFHRPLQTILCASFGRARRKMMLLPNCFVRRRARFRCAGFVTGSPDLARRARTLDRIVVTLDEHALKLWSQSGAKNLAELMSPAWAEETGPTDLLVSTVPELAEVLRDEVQDTARCQSVARLKLIIGGHSDLVPCLMWNNSLLLDLAQLASLSRADRLRVCSLKLRRQDG